MIFELSLCSFSYILQKSICVAISIINRLIAITEPIPFYCSLLIFWQLKTTFWQIEVFFIIRSAIDTTTLTYNFSNLAE